MIYDINNDKILSFDRIWLLIFFNRNFVVILKILIKIKSLKCIYENILNMDLYILYIFFFDVDIEFIFDRVS